MAANAVNGSGQSSYRSYLPPLEAARHDCRQSLERGASRSSSPQEIIGISGIFHQDLPVPQPRQYLALDTRNVAKHSPRHEPSRRERDDDLHGSYRFHQQKHRVIASNPHSPPSSKSVRHASNSNVDNGRPAGRSSSPQEIVGIFGRIHRDLDSQPKRDRISGTRSASIHNLRPESNLRQERDIASHRSYRSYQQKHQGVAPSNSRSSSLSRGMRPSSSSNVDNLRRAVSPNLDVGNHHHDTPLAQRLRQANERIERLSNRLSLVCRRFGETCRERDEAQEKFRRAHEINMEFSNQIIVYSELWKNANQEIERLRGPQVQYPVNDNARAELISNFIRRVANEAPKPLQENEENAIDQSPRHLRRHDLQGEPRFAGRNHAHPPQDDIEPGAQPGLWS